MAHIDHQEAVMSKPEGYNRLFDHLRDIFLNDDFSIANLETTISDNIEISGYPRFSAKTALADAIKSAGIDMVSCANNHAYDYNDDGVVTTYEALKKRDILFHGIGYSEKDVEQFKIIKINNITIAVYSITFSLNGMKNKRFTPSESPYINYYPPNDTAAKNSLLRKIKGIKPKVDVVMILYHGGTEYKITPDKNQIEYFRSFLGAGADIILGHHPHVIQRSLYYKDNKGNNKLYIYSLGNLVSGQGRYFKVKEPMPDYSDKDIRTSESIILQFDIVKWNKKISIHNPRIIPLFNIFHEEKRNDNTKNKFYYFFDTIPMNKILLYDGEKHPELKYAKEIIKVRYEKIKQITGFANHPDY